MDRLTSKLENYFVIDDSNPLMDPGVDTPSSTDASIKIIDTDKKDIDDDESSKDGSKIAEASLSEANKAATIEEKEKLLSAVKQNVDQIKSDLGELLKNTWASKIVEIQSEMSKMEQDKKKNIASAASDSKQI